VWKDNNPGRQSYFLRTPGYGLFRYALMGMIGFWEELSLFQIHTTVSFCLFSIASV
jgi:hypothetical protein